MNHLLLDNAGSGNAVTCHFWGAVYMYMLSLMPHTSMLKHTCVFTSVKGWGLRQVHGGCVRIVVNTPIKV